MAEQQPTFDAAKYKNAQREQWNKEGAAWRRWNPTLDRWYGEVTRKMLDLARIQPGQRILDIAAGAGEPAVSAAEQVGPSGYVLATDISEGIVELALQVARERGLKQIETRAMDGEKLDLPDASFDAVLCRLGLIYMPHPVTALREWRRALRPGGRVAVVVGLARPAEPAPERVDRDRSEEDRAGLAEDRERGVHDLHEVIWADGAVRVGRRQLHREAGKPLADALERGRGCRRRWSPPPRPTSTAWATASSDRRAPSRSTRSRPTRTATWAPTSMSRS